MYCVLSLWCYFVTDALLANANEHQHAHRYPTERIKRSILGGHRCTEYQNVTNSNNRKSEPRGSVERRYTYPTGANFGNHLFMYAAAFGIAKANDFTLLHEPWNASLGPNIFEVFKIRPTYVEKRKIETVALVEPQGEAHTFEAACAHLRPHLHYGLGGFRQSFKYFEDEVTARALRASLQFQNDTLAANAEAWLCRVKASTGKSRIVGIHIRSGIAGNRYFVGCLPPPEFYRKSIIAYRYFS